MQIKFIDVPAQGNDEDAVRVEYQGLNHQKSYQTESFTSPFSASLRKTLAWYFNQYPGQYELETDTKDDRNVVQKMIRGGQGLGDELMGEDYELVKVCEDIVEGCHSQLDVQFISERPGFFSELWETLILPDSKYVLASAARSFVRRIGNADTPELPALSYQLKVTQPTNEQVVQMLQGEVDANLRNDRKDDKPLRVLYWVARPQSVNEAFDGSNGLNLALEASRDGGGVIYDIQKAAGQDKLEALLSDKDNPVHVLHYDGPVLVDGDDLVSIITDDETEKRMSVKGLSQLMVKNQVALLSVDARRYLRHTPKKVLAMIAQAGYKEGLGNVLGLSQIANPWISARCFDQIYRLLVTGLELAEAVVQARKLRQRITTTDLLTPKALKFHDWSLVVHYSWQKLQFFTQGLALDKQEDPNYLTRIHEKLFGFQAMMMPPLQFNSSDGQTLAALEHLQKEGGVTVTGVAGGGKSHLTHTLCTYLASAARLDYGFNFDFSKDVLTPGDILQMLANLLQLPDAQKQQVLDALAQHRCVFVFDELVLTQELIEFIGELQNAGHWIIATTEQRSSLSALDLPLVELQPLSLLEQKILAAHSLRQLKTDETVALDTWHELLEAAQGNPWLTVKLMAKLSTYSGGALLSELNKHIKGTADIVEQYYRWQWQKLAAPSRQMLLYCSEVKGLLLEMLVVAAEGKTPFEPAEVLFEDLGAGDEKLSDWVNNWSACGFVNTFPHGRMLDSRCLPFLARQGAVEWVDSHARVCFSKLVSQGVCLLSQKLSEQPNHNITNNLLFHRRSWVEHFEQVWRAKDYSLFFNCKNTFAGLLSKAELENEYQLWSMDMLARYPDPAEISDKVAWLSLASTFVENTHCEGVEYIAQAEQKWRLWYDELALQMANEVLPLFHQAACFLQGCYKRQQRWQDAVTVTERALEVYLQHNAWPRTIQTFKDLAMYHSQLGEEDKALAYEDRMLDDVLYDKVSPGLKTQTMQDIMFARLIRGNTLECQKMLDQLRLADFPAPDFERHLDAVQHEIYFKDGEYEKILPEMCELWLDALQSEQNYSIERVKQRMEVVAKHMGQEAFDVAFDSYVPQGTPRPV